MFKVTGNQFEKLSVVAKDGFAERLLRHLERNCPATALPLEAEAKYAFTCERIAAAREKGLTWEKTIAEHARLATLRRAGEQVVDPNLFAGDDPRVADAQFMEAMRRSELVRRVEEG